MDKPTSFLPGMVASSGPIYLGYRRVEAVPTALAFMGIRELAHKSVDKAFEARTVVANSLSGKEAAARSTDYAVSVIGTFAAVGPFTQGRLMAELLRYIGFHQDATGLEGVLTSFIQSAWQHLTPSMAVQVIEIWRHFVDRSAYAREHPILAYDERTKRLKVFAPGELATMDPRASLQRKLAQAAENVFVGGGKPDFRGGGPNGGWKARDAQDTDHFFEGFFGSPTDWNSPGGWDGNTNTPWGRGRNPMDAGGSGPDYRSGAPQPGDRPGEQSGGLPGIPGFDGGGSIFDQSNPFNQGNPFNQFTGPGKAFREGGPFSEGFIGRPGPYGPEAFDGYDDEGKAQAKSKIAGYEVSGGIALLGIGATTVVGGLLGPLGPWGVAGGFVLIGLGGAAMLHGSETIREAEKELADAKRQQQLEKEQRDAEREKEKEREKQKQLEQQEKDKKKDQKPPPKDDKPKPKKEGEAGIYPDPYGDGGGVNWSGLSQLPVDDGGGGVGPKWLNALPTDDGQGVGPTMNYLPADDGTSGGRPRPNSVVSFVAPSIAGPGMESLIIRTSKSTAALIGMPKLRSDGSIADAGVLAGVV